MSNINLPFDIDSLRIESQRVDNEGNIVLTVVSKCDHSTCHKCGKPATKPNGVAPPRRIRHLPILDHPVYLEIRPQRYNCDDCDKSTTEQYDWVSRNSTTTKGLEDYILRCVVNLSPYATKKRTRWRRWGINC